MREINSQISSAVLIGPISTDADVAATYVDLQGFDSAMIEVAVGIGGITFTSSNKIEFELYESDAANGAGATLVAAADITNGPGLGAGIIRALTAAHAAATVRTVGYIGSKRYIGVVANFSGTHAAATPIAATVHRGHPRNSPTY